MSQAEITRRELLGAAATAASAAATGRERNATDPFPKPLEPNSNRERIEAALTQLLSREVGAFVIFEERTSAKFVQFTGSSPHGLFLDIPSQTLNATEMEKAKVFLPSQGIGGDSYCVFDGPGGKVVGRQFAFQKDYGRDVSGAAKIACDVFSVIYQFPDDFDLVVTEG